MDEKKDLILIVDDNIKNLEVLTKICKDEGYLLSLAQDGPTALEQLKSITPDLILLDIMMPEMSGLELCRTIKKNDKLRDIPIIFVTAKTQMEDLVEGFNAGGVDYIAKPFNRIELMVRVKNHLELYKSKQKILEMNQTRDKLYSIIAHDIRAPFSSIKFVINFIADGLIDPASKEFKDIIKELAKSTDETSTLLNNLLEWTKFQSGSLVISPKLLDIYPVVLECMHLLSANACNKTISLTHNIPQETTAYFDEISMHTVFRNLISNAIKFTPEGGAITLTSETKEHFLIIKVTDSGIGIRPEVLNKLFDKNEHYTTLGTRKEQGSGFGLILIDDFVKQNHGKIEVESEVGKGTTFSVYIPLNKEAYQLNPND